MSDQQLENTENVEKPIENKEVEVKSKHRVPGKHSLKWDPIFKGKKSEIEEEDDNYTNVFQLSPQTNFSEQYKNQDEHNRQKFLKEKVFEILTLKTKINLKTNRRKPSKTDFNIYYELLLNECEQDNFSRSELFVELSYYFSDNLFNMFKLLYKNHSAAIIHDLVDKYKLPHIKSIDLLMFNDF